MGHVGRARGDDGRAKYRLKLREPLPFFSATIRYVIKKPLSTKKNRTAISPPAFK